MERRPYPGNRWGNITREDFIRLYPTTANAELSRISGLSVGLISSRAFGLDLHKDPAYLQQTFQHHYEQNLRGKMTGRIAGRYANWGSIGEETFRAIYAVTPDKELATMIGITVRSMHNRAKHLGLTKDQACLERMRADYLDSLRTKNWGTITLEQFVALYPTSTNQELARLSGLHPTTLSVRAYRMGLRKSHEHLSEIGRQHYERFKDKMIAASIGRPANPDIVARLVRFNTGRRYTEEEKRAISERGRASLKVRRGPAHHAWKGGKTKKEGRRSCCSKEYLDWRRAVLERDDYRCQRCGYAGTPTYTRQLRSHHIQPWCDYPALRFDVDNGETLCRQCHDSHHGMTRKSAILKPCSCGCGKAIPSITKAGRARQYAVGHDPATKERKRATHQRNRLAGLHRSTEDCGAISQEEFIAMYPTHSERAMAELTGLTESMVEIRAKRFGLRKDPEYRKAAWRASAANATEAKRRHKTSQHN